MKLITEETKRLIRLVNENLDYEKIRSNQITLQKLHYPLIEVFEIIKEQLALQAEEKQNQLILDVEDHVMVNAITTGSSRYSSILRKTVFNSQRTEPFG